MITIATKIGMYLASGLGLGRIMDFFDSDESGDIGTSMFSVTSILLVLIVGMGAFIFWKTQGKRR